MRGESSATKRGNYCSHEDCGSMHDLVDFNTQLLIGPEIANFTPYQIGTTQSLVDYAHHNVGVFPNLLLYSRFSRSIGQFCVVSELQSLCPALRQAVFVFKKR